MRIVLCYPVESHHQEEIQSVASQLEMEAAVVNAGQAGVAEALLEADIFCGHAKVPVDWEAIVSQKRLQWIQSSAAGLDHCLVPSVVDSEIVVTSASGLFARQVAEQTMALLLGWLRSLPTFHEATQKREFVRKPTQDLYGKTIGIVGFGGNGRQIAKALHPFGTTIIATDLFPVDKPEYVSELWPADQLSRLMNASDVVVLAIPLTAETYHLIDEPCLANMRAGSILVNVARGSVVEESALIRALDSNHLSAALLDVVEFEPLAVDSPLWSMENVMITPHVGAQSAHRVDVTTRFFCENLKRFHANQRLLNFVEKAIGFPRPEDRVVSIDDFF